MLTNTITSTVRPIHTPCLILLPKTNTIRLDCIPIGSCASPGLQRQLSNSRYGTRQTKALTAIAAKYEIEEDTSGMPTEETPKNPHPSLLSALEENLTCVIVKQVLNLELQRLPPGSVCRSIYETARMMVLRFIGGELSEAEFWNSICNSDTCRPVINGEQQPNYPKHKHRSDTFDGPGAIPFPLGSHYRYRYKHGPNTIYYFPELRPALKPPKMTQRVLIPNRGYHPCRRSIL